MIKVEVIKENNFLKEITIKGHANYDDYGKDIVCASVSSMVITTVNGILSIDKDVIDVIEKNGFTKIEVIKNTLVADNLLNNLIDLLKELEEQYPENIQIL